MRESNFGLLAVFVLTSFRMFGDCGQQQLSCSSSPLGYGCVLTTMTEPGRCQGEDVTKTPTGCCYPSPKPNFRAIDLVLDSVGGSMHLSECSTVEPVA
jgi:hypothetical protein